MEKTIRLYGMESVRCFVTTVSGFSEHMELRSGDIAVNPKSIMGLLSLDLNKAMTLHFEAGKKRRREICNAIADYLAD